MSKFCPNCGRENEDIATYCAGCGSSLNSFENQQVNINITNNNYSNPIPTVPNRSIALAIVLSIITCGIYGIYWFIVMTDESNKVSNDNNTASGVLAFIFTIITCGIYGFYWYYKMGQKLYQAGKLYNKEIPDNGVLYLVLGLFGLGIISYALIQSDLNKFSN